MTANPDASSRSGARSTSGAQSRTDARNGAAEPGIGDLGQIIGDIGQDLSTLLRQEVELAKAELQQSAVRAGRGAGMLAGAAVAAVLALVFLSVTVWWAIGNATGRSWSALIVAAIWAVVAAVLAAVGRGQLSSMSGLQRTAGTVREIPDAMKGHDPSTSQRNEGTPR